jgi:hypothetical protein
MPKQVSYMQPDIVTTRRIGRVQTGKNQLLSVPLRRAEQAQQLINIAKRLCKSSNPTVKKYVYISPNLTQAEAKAAYQLRQKRRQAALLCDRNDASDASHGQDAKFSVSPIPPTQYRQHFLATCLLLNLVQGGTASMHRGR